MNRRSAVTGQAKIGSHTVIWLREPAILLDFRECSYFVTRTIRVNGNWTAALASLRLLGHMARIIQNRLEDERRGRENSIDRKLRRKIEEKKQAHGLKQ